jgi:pantoate--beta-alanine ligase
MKTVVTAAELSAEISTAKAAGKKIAFVPTMGALHDGHISLVELAKSNNTFVVVSIFVNPLQFGPNEDFEKYPRDLAADARLLESAGANLLFAPTGDVIYPNGPNQTPQKSAGSLGTMFEGKSRPGHFDGMLTVVARLFDLVQPDLAIFGAKDAQQVALIKRMATADFPDLKIVEAPIVRERSGLALSSRNRYLDQDQLKIAQVLSAALRAAAKGADGGAPAFAALESATTELARVPEAKLDYIALVDAETFEPVGEDFSGRAKLLIAARVGETRLIDNTDLNF